MRFFTLIVVLLITHLANGQPSREIDSLKQALKTNLADTAKLNILVRLSAIHHFIDFAKAKTYSIEAIELAKNLDDNKAKATAYENAATLYAISGDFSRALHYDNLSLENSIILRDTIKISSGYNRIGTDYYDLGEYDDAYFYFTQSHRYASAIKDTLRMLIALHNVGRVFKELGQYDQAVSHLNLALDMSQKHHDEEGFAYSYSELGDVLLRQKKYDSALHVLMKSLAVSKKLKIEILIPVTLTKMAQAFIQKGDYETAYSYYDTIFQLHSKTNNRYGIAEVELGRGIVLAKQQKYANASSRIESSLAIAKSLNARVLEIRCYNELSLIDELTGDYQASLKHYKRFKHLEDTLFSQEMQGKLLRDHIQFETEARDSKIAVLSEQQAEQKNELKKQEFVRNILVVVMALSGILLITVYRSGQRRRKINRLLLQHQEEMEKRSEELERLNQVKDKFFSIISHDLRSPINALSGMLDLLDKGAVKAEEFGGHIRELTTRFNHTRTLLDNLLDWTLLQMDKLNLQAVKIDLHKIVEENIQLLGPIQSKDIKLINRVPNPAIGFADSNTINLVIRNLMTNAIKFTKDKGEVVISAEERSFEWHVSVKDNGIGIKRDVLQILFDKTAPYTTRGTANEKGTGLGLILCKEFVEKNGGKIWVESQEGHGSTFYFTLPKAQ